MFYKTHFLTIYIVNTYCTSVYIVFCDFTSTLILKCTICQAFLFVFNYVTLKHIQLSDFSCIHDMSNLTHLQS